MTTKSEKKSDPKFSRMDESELYDIKEFFKHLYYDEKNELVDGASNRLAGIIGAIVMCGELSLLAALTNQDELVKSHILFERTITK